jgi:hypothetical protein
MVYQHPDWLRLIHWRCAFTSPVDIHFAPLSCVCLIRLLISISPVKKQLENTEQHMEAAVVLGQMGAWEKAFVMIMVHYFENDSIPHSANTSTLKPSRHQHCLHHSVAHENERH